MARTMSKEVLEQKIEKVQIAITKNREQYERLTAAPPTLVACNEGVGRKKCRFLITTG